MFYFVYKTVNLLNNRIYVGQHKQNEKEFDGYLGSGIYLQRAIKKYGKENFVREFIEFCSEENLNEREIYWIDKLEARNPKVGYNLSKGGTGGNVAPWNNERKLKISLANRNVPKTEEHKEKLRIFRTGLKHKIETIEKISLKTKGRNNPMFGKKHSDESKKKMSLKKKGKVLLGKDNPNFGKLKGRNHPGSKFVYQFICGDIVYNEVYEFTKFCKEHNLNISSVYRYINTNKEFKGWKINRRNWRNG